MPSKGTTAAKREERIEALRILVLEDGEPRWRALKTICAAYGVSKRTAQRDMATLAERVQATFDDKAFCELEVRKSFDMLEKIARQAYDDGKYSAAVAALRERVKLLGRRTDRWARRNDVDPTTVHVDVQTDAGGRVAAVSATVTRRAQELLEADEEALERRALELRERFQVLDGERGEAPPEAAEGLAR